MTDYALLSLVVALLAVVISAVSLIRTSKLQRQQLRLNAVTEELTRRQLQSMAAEEAARQKGRVVASLEGASPKWWFLLKNEGPAAVREVNFELIDCPDSPLVRGDYDRKLPVSVLQPDGEVRLTAAIHHGTPSTFTAKVSWTNPDGSQSSDDYAL